MSKDVSDAMLAQQLEQQQLLAGVAHELKQPLALISGLSRQMRTGKVSQETMDQYLERVQFSSDRLLRLIDGIMKGYQVDQQRLELNLEPINPGLIMEDVAHELQPLAKKQAQVVNVKSVGKHLVLADKDCLHAVLFNLLDNAVKYSDPEAMIELSSRQRSGLTQVVVKDYGRGLKKADLRRIFKVFGRASTPVPGWATTTGLGLYVAKQLTEAMGGSLNLTRRRDGSNFLVTMKPSTQLSLLDGLTV